MIKFTLRIPEELHTRLTDQAATDRRSLNSELLHLIEIGLDAISPETPNRPSGDSTTRTPLHESGHPPQP